jgi:hypothetical protein
VVQCCRRAFYYRWCCLARVGTVCGVEPKLLQRLTCFSSTPSWKKLWPIILWWLFESPLEVSLIIIRIFQNPNPTVTSDRNDYEIMVHSAQWIIFQTFVLASALAVLCYGLWKLINYVQFYGPQFSIAQICLGLQVVGTCGTFNSYYYTVNVIYIRSFMTTYYTRGSQPGLSFPF